LPVSNIAAVAAIALLGPGRYSLDAVFSVQLPEPAVAIAGAAAVAIGVGTAFGSRLAQAASPGS